jgi:hypothetical protein
VASGQSLPPKLGPRVDQTGCDLVLTDGTVGHGPSSGLERLPTVANRCYPLLIYRVRLLSRGSQVRVLPGVPLILQTKSDENTTPSRGEPTSVCTSVCTPLDAATIQAAIVRVTIALTTVRDEEIPGLVAERRALRQELRARRAGRGSGEAGRASEGED